MSNVTQTTNLESMIRMLDAGRFDLMVTDLFSGQISVKEINLQSHIHPLLPPLQRIYIYHYLHERHRDLVDKVGKVIEEMDASGELAQLRERLIKQVLEKP